MRITIPTLFTIARIGLIPMIVTAMINAYWGMALLLFTCACLTDLVDGFLARLLDEKTFLGACLDPVADKLLLIACFSTFAFIATPLFSIPYAFLLFIVGKELLQIAGAIIIYQIQGHLNVQPTLLGKVTTFIQMIFIIWLLACYFFSCVPIKTYYVMLSVMIFFIGASFIQYVRIGMRMITQKSKK